MYGMITIYIGRPSLIYILNETHTFGNHSDRSYVQFRARDKRHDTNTLSPERQLEIHPTTNENQKAKCGPATPFVKLTKELGCAVNNLRLRAM